MRKFLLSLILVLALVVPCFASPADWLKEVPKLKQGIMYNWQDSKVEYLSTLEVAEWKNVTLEVGYSSEDALMGVVSYPVLKLKDLGINIPLLDLVEFNLGLGAGVSRIGSGEGNNEIVYGVTLTLLNIKF